jgi:hypothetical protein
MYLVACDVHCIIVMITCAWNDDFVHAILGKGNIACVMFTSYLGVPYKSRVDHTSSNLCDHKVR